ncbi:hypothetical protein OG410_26255 [Streptomyces sp. NBC_00659]|uniref:hypothetical protein n=1 Tax=Streptomyces sp. NBC_00659 TaxID=2903669 RepID=UPI002E30DDA3|nr:hypothetical protein [Streptomyces sp. NBC_00659]
MTASRVFAPDSARWAPVATVALRGSAQASAFSAPALTAAPRAVVAAEAPAPRARAPAPAPAVDLPGEGAQTFAALSGVVPAFPAAVAPLRGPGARLPVVPASSAPAPPVAAAGAGADIARLSGVTRIHPVSADAVPAAVESGRRSGEVPGPVAPDDARWAGGRVSAGRGPGRVLVACGVSRFVMVVPPR